MTTPSASRISSGRDANSLGTTKSSAEHVRTSKPGPSEKGVARLTTLSSNGRPPNDTSMPTPEVVRSNRTLHQRANSAASSIRAGRQPEEA